MDKNRSKSTVIKTSPPKTKNEDNLEVGDLGIPRITVSPHGKYKKSGSKNSYIESSNNFGNDLINVNMNSAPGNNECEKCGNIKENINSAINHIRSYVDSINDRLNMVYHKTSSIKKQNSNVQDEYFFSPDYYHTLYYSDMDKLKLGGEVLAQFRFLMKSIRLFNDKFEYITKKHENIERMAQEHKNYKISNKIEELNQLPESDINEVKNLEIHSIFKNFNMAKENFESSLKDLKNNINHNNERSSQMIGESFELNNAMLDSGREKEAFLKNELSRLIKENTSLKLEMNYVYEQLREEGRIYEIKEDRIITSSVKRNPFVKESSPNPRESSKEKRDSNFTMSMTKSTSTGNFLNNNLTIKNNLNHIAVQPVLSPRPDTRSKKKSTSINFSSGSIDKIGGGSLKEGPSYNNPTLVIQIKGDKKDESYLIAKNYIKQLKQTEFYML